MSAFLGGWTLLLLAFAGCASAPVGGERRTVTAEGSAPADAPSARDRALADAQKRAVEKALGVSLAASTRVEGAVATRRRIWADARGRIESWTVVGDRTEGGFRLVNIRAVVVRLAEGEEAPPPGEAKVRIEAAGAEAEGLRRSFGTRGFTLVENGADFVVKGAGSSTILRDARTAPFVTGRGRVKVSVVETATGAVVWERSVEASGLDSDARSAAALAVASAGELGGREAADSLSRWLWTR